MTTSGQPILKPIHIRQVATRYLLGMMASVPFTTVFVKLYKLCDHRNYFLYKQMASKHAFAGAFSDMSLTSVKKLFLQLFDNKFKLTDGKQSQICFEEYSSTALFTACLLQNSTVWHITVQMCATHTGYHFLAKSTSMSSRDFLKCYPQVYLKYFSGGCEKVGERYIFRKIHCKAVAGMLYIILYI